MRTIVTWTTFTPPPTPQKALPITWGGTHWRQWFKQTDGFSQSGRADGRGDYRRRRLRSGGASVSSTAIEQPEGYYSMPSPWTTCGNASQLTCAHACLSFMCVASPIAEPAHVWPRTRSASNEEVYASCHNAVPRPHHHLRGLDGGSSWRAPPKQGTEPPRPGDEYAYDVLFKGPAALDRGHGNDGQRLAHCFPSCTPTSDGNSSIEA